MADVKEKDILISLGNLGTFKDELVKKIDAEDAKALKTMAVDAENHKVFLYRSEEPIKEGAAPDYTLDLSDIYTALSGLSDDVEKITGEGEGSFANAISTLENALAAVAKSGTAADVALVDAGEKFTATNVEAAFLEVANALKAIEDKIGTVGADTTVMSEIADIQDKLDDVADGAQVNVIETVKLNGVALTVTDKAVDVVIPNEDKNLTYAQIMNPEAEEVDGYHGATDKEVTSAYLYNQFATILPNVIKQVDGVFDLASNIQYKTVETYADLQKVETKDFEAGIYVYLVKQDENYVRFENEDGNPTQYYTTIYIYLTNQPDDGWELVGKLNISEALLEQATSTAIKNALMTSITGEDGEIHEVTKFYTRTEGEAVAKAVADEVTRATGVEEGLDERLQAVEEALGGEGSVAEAIKDAVEALDATVSTVTVEDADPVLNISVTETDGKLTAISASIKENTFDAHGAADAVLGTSADTADKNTVFGAKAYADSLVGAGYTVASESQIKALFAPKSEEVTE